MKAISVSLLSLILISSIFIITLEESIATSKASDKGERTTEKAKDKAEDIGERLSELGKPSNNYNNNENMQNGFDNSEDKENNKVSIADELRELSQLKKEGIITEEEFTEMKEDLIK
jgi:hypothetical protein